MLQIGDAVKLKDESGEDHDALVTAIHGVETDQWMPLINAVYVTSDKSKYDPYGAQLERLSSLSHRDHPHAPRGRYYWV